MVYKHDMKEYGEIDSYDLFFFSCIMAVPFIVFSILCCIQIIDIITCLTFPEKIVFREVMEIYNNYK